MTRPPTPPNSPFGSLGSRFGMSKVNWEIVPISDTVVIFDLNGLGDPLYRLVNSKKRKDVTDRQAVIQATQETGPTLSSLTSILDKAWDSYELRGAALVYVWRDEVKQAITARVNKDKNPLTCLRVTDPLFVLNVLARARSHILLATSGLALEQGFLDRSLIADDARLIALAHSIGCVKETFADERNKS